MFGINGYFLTGRQILGNITRIDLFFSAEQAAVWIGESERPLLLDEGESTLARRYSELAVQAAINDAEDHLLTVRCDRLESQRRASKLNRQGKKPRATEAGAASDQIHRIK